MHLLPPRNPPFCLHCIAQLRCRAAPLRGRSAAPLHCRCAAQLRSCAAQLRSCAAAAAPPQLRARACCRHPHTARLRLPPMRKPGNRCLARGPGPELGGQGGEFQCNRKGGGKKVPSTGRGPRGVAERAEFALGWRSADSSHCAPAAATWFFSWLLPFLHQLDQQLGGLSTVHSNPLHSCRAEHLMCARQREQQRALNNRSRRSADPGYPGRPSRRRSIHGSCSTPLS